MEMQRDPYYFTVTKDRILILSSLVTDEVLINFQQLLIHKINNSHFNFYYVHVHENSNSLL